MKGGAAESVTARAFHRVHTGWLGNGGDRCQGQVELLYQGCWDTVCDDSWDARDADVVCPQLGCGHSLPALGGTHPGQGTGDVLVGTVHCLGREYPLPRPVAPQRVVRP